MWNLFRRLVGTRLNILYNKSQNYGRKIIYLHLNVKYEWYKRLKWCITMWTPYCLIILRIILNCLCCFPSNCTLIYENAYVSKYNMEKIVLLYESKWRDRPTEGVTTLKNTSEYRSFTSRFKRHNTISSVTISV